MNLDFLAMNLTGFTFYSIYSSYGYFYPGGSADTGQVDLNDLIFAYHALFITILTVGQAFYYPQGKNKIMKVTIVYLCALWLFCIIYGSITLVIIL
jgi:cystinosin